MAWSIWSERCRLIVEGARQFLGPRSPTSFAATRFNSFFASEVFVCSLRSIPEACV